MPWQSQTFQILIKSCCIESRNDPSPKTEVVGETKFSLKISYSTHVCLAQLDRHQTCKPVMVSCEFNSHWRQLYFLKTPQCSMLFKKTSNNRDILYGSNTSIVFILIGMVTVPKRNISRGQIVSKRLWGKIEMIVL